MLTDRNIVMHFHLFFLGYSKGQYTIKGTLGQVSDAQIIIRKNLSHSSQREQSPEAEVISMDRSPGFPSAQHRCCHGVRQEAHMSGSPAFPSAPHHCCHGTRQEDAYVDGCSHENVINISISMEPLLPCGKPRCSHGGIIKMAQHSCPHRVRQEDAHMNGSAFPSSQHHCCHGVKQEDAHMIHDALMEGSSAFPSVQHRCCLGVRQEEEGADIVQLPQHQQRATDESQRTTATLSVSSGAASLHQSSDGDEASTSAPTYSVPYPADSHQENSHVQDASFTTDIADICSHSNEQSEDRGKKQSEDRLEGNEQGKKLGKDQGKNQGEDRSKEARGQDDQDENQRETCGEPDDSLLPSNTSYPTIRKLPCSDTEVNTLREKTTTEIDEGQMSEYMATSEVKERPGQKSEAAEIPEHKSKATELLGHELEAMGARPKEY